MRLYLRSKWYNIDTGSTLTENYNETLDSANVRISHLTEEIDIEPFDDVILQDEDGRLVDRYMCVDSYESTQEGLDTPTYTYSISLFSQTKKLENIILPNLSITPRRDITIRRTIEDYLSQYLEEYGDENWSFADRVSSKFFDYAPELQWNKPTFREVLTDLMMVKDCIPVLRNNVIDYIDLTVSQDLGNKTGINYIKKSQNSDDYVSEIRMELQNVMQTSVEGINNVVTTTEYIPFTSDEWRVTDENLYLKTQFPILRVNHLWIYLFPVNAYKTGEENGIPIGTARQRIIKVDLCNLKNGVEDLGGSLLKESKDYQTLNILYRTDLAGNAEYSSFAGFQFDNYFSQYQNYCIYYTRGSNRIQGFDTTTKNKVFSVGSRTTLQWIKTLAFFSYAKETGYWDSWIEVTNNFVPDNINNVSVDPTYYSTFFQIEYETTYNALFSASKEKKPHNSRVMSDNQTNSWVDIYSQGFLEYQKANRLGNKNLQINQRTTGNDLITIGDRYNNNIVYRTEYQIYKDHIEVNAGATEYYILQNYFTSIKSRIRTWVNAKDEAFERHDLVKLYCELAYSPVNDMSIGNHLSTYLISPLNVALAKPIRFVGVKTTKDMQTWYGLYSLNCTTKLVGKSVVLTFGFDDNWFVSRHVYSYVDPLDSSDDEGIVADNVKPYDLQYAGNRLHTFNPPSIRTTTNGVVYGGIPLNNYGYTDSLGEFKKISYAFADDISITEERYLVNTNDINIDISTAQIKTLFTTIFDLPKVRNEAFDAYTRYSHVLEIHKDNKEIPIISTQFEFRTANRNIIVTNNFVKQQRMIRNVDLTTGGSGQVSGSSDLPNLKIYASSSLQETLPTDVDIMTGAWLSYSEQYESSQNIEIHHGGYDFENKDTIYVCDNDNNVLFATKKQNGNSTNLYLNIRRKL